MPEITNPCPTCAASLLDCAVRADDTKGRRRCCLRCRHELSDLWRKVAAVKTVRKLKTDQQRRIAIEYLGLDERFLTTNTNN